MNPDNANKLLVKLELILGREFGLLVKDLPLVREFTSSRQCAYMLRGVFSPKGKGWALSTLHVHKKN